MGWQDAPEVSNSSAWMNAPEVIPDQKSKKGTASVAERVFQGAIQDPVDAGVQILSRILPKRVQDAGNALNNFLAEKTGMFAKVPEGGMDEMIRSAQREYSAMAPDGVDWARVGGAIASPVNFIPGIALAGKPAGVMKSAAASIPSALISSPVVEGDFAKGKVDQALQGALAGGVASGLINGISRIVMPKAAANPNLAKLEAEGVTPTIGQTLGGRWNAMEEKLQSFPFLGDAIANARLKANKQFNNAAINRSLSPIGEKIEGEGHAAIKEAGDRLSAAYEKTLGKINHVQFDGQFADQLRNLEAMSANLVPTMKERFDKTLSSVFSGRSSPNGSMLPEVYKKVDSELGMLASKWQKSTSASESELGDAVAELKSMLNQQMRRSNPQVAAELENIDKGWANIVRLEGAASSAKNNEGIFTPAQLNQAIKNADQSTRKRSVGRGTSLMQDLGSAGQQVLGNKVPNSGTVDRGLIAALPAMALSPWFAASLLAEPTLYSAAGQNALRTIVSKRPESANKLADLIRNATPYGVAPAGAVGVQLGK